MSSFSSTQPPDDNLGLDPAAPSAPLQACSECEALIDVTENEPLAKVTCPSCGAKLIVRCQIGPFKLESIAGRGGMGVVYKALDTRLNRHVALKLLRKDHSGNETLIAQLATEAAITASINHPNVVKVFSTGTDRGRFYLAMELISEGTLADLMKAQGRLPEAKALQVGIQIAQGLRAANQHGLIHRDVKPGNILFDANGATKIVDFGLAIFMEDEELARGEIWGTPYYVAPEKLEHLPEDFRSDIYSLGGTLFHALAGRPPFEAESASMVALKHLKAQPVSLQAFATHVSGSTAYIINRTLLKDPEERYQSYDEFIEHLQYAHRELLENAARPQQRRVVLESAADQKAWGWITAGMIIVILGLAVAGFLFRGKPTANTGKAVASVTRSQASLEASIFAPGREQLAKGNGVAAAEAFEGLEKNANLSPLDLAWATYQKGIARLAAGDLAKAREAFSQVNSHATKLGPDNAGLAAFFQETSAKLQGEAPIPAALAEKLSKADHEGLALLGFGLHAWHSGRNEEGAALLRQFRAASPTGQNAWLSRLKPLATAAIDELIQFQMLAKRFTDAQSPEERLAELPALREVQGRFATRAQEVLESHKAELAELEQLLARLPKEGLYKITNRKTGQALTVSGGSAANETPIVAAEYEGGLHQLWTLVKEGLNFSLLTRHTDSHLDLNDASMDNGAKIQIWDGVGRSQAEHWQFQPQPGGYFKIVNNGSKKPIGVVEGKLATTVVQQDAANIPEQDWRIESPSSNLGAWTHEDIGARRPGFTLLDEKTGQFIVTSESDDMWNKADSFTFIHQTVTGNFELIVRVLGLETNEERVKCGLMIRADTSSNAANFLAGITALKGVISQIRTVADGDTGLRERPNIAPPRWLKLKREGDTCNAFESGDGKTWEQHASETLVLAPTVEAGFALATKNVSTKAVFDNFRLKKLP